MTGSSQEPVGSAAEEAARLFGALGAWARTQGEDWGPVVGGVVDGLASQAAAAAHDVDAHLATDAEECRWCPVCRAVRALRTASPEVREHLGAAAASLAQAAAALLATPAPEAPRSGVERIDLDEWPEEQP